MSDFIKLLLLLGYLVASGVSLAAYFPQLVKMFRHPAARRDTSKAMWVMWTVGGVLECLYAGFVAHQWVWILVALVHTLFCGTAAWLACFCCGHRAKIISDLPQVRFIHRSTWKVVKQPSAWTKAKVRIVVKNHAAVVARTVLEPKLVHNGTSVRSISQFGTQRQPTLLQSHQLSL